MNYNYLNINKKLNYFTQSNSITLSSTEKDLISTFYQLILFRFFNVFKLENNKTYFWVANSLLLKRKRSNYKTDRQLRRIKSTLIEKGLLSQIYCNETRQMFLSLPDELTDFLKKTLKEIKTSFEKVKDVVYKGFNELKNYMKDKANEIKTQKRKEEKQENAIKRLKELKEYKQIPLERVCSSELKHKITNDIHKYIIEKEAINMTDYNGYFRFFEYSINSQNKLCKSTCFYEIDYQVSSEGHKQYIKVLREFMKEYYGLYKLNKLEHDL